MKKLFTIACFLTGSLISKDLTAQCPTLAEPNQYTWCYGGIDRYLARATFASGLTDQLTTGPYQKYSDNINLFADLNAAYISRVANLWGWETKMIPGNAYYLSAQQAVRDINEAYDCRLQRRPVLEAAILEYVSTDINNVPIPAYLLLEFQNDPDFIAANYGIFPPTYFDHNQIVYPGTNTPDINRIQARMWFYYLAKEFLDMGFMALHVGAYNAVAVNDPGFVKTHELFKKIRDYAASLGPDKFVWLNADTDKDLYFMNTNQLLLDFNSTPLRPEDNYNDYSGTPCDGQMNTELNFTKYFPNIINSTGGIAPNGCTYTRTPILFNLDWCCDPDLNAPHHTGAGWHPWGYDEMSWFKLLPEECQAYWLESVACAIKNDLVYRGYLKMPGFELDWQMSDYPLVVETVKELVWKPNTHTNFTINPICEYGCDDKLIRKYILRVTNPDCSSVYTFHIQKPDGSWMLFSTGAERVLADLPAGRYSIYLRQDNLGFPVGSETIQIRKYLEVIDDMPCHFTNLDTEEGVKKQANSGSTSNIPPITPENIAANKTMSDNAGSKNLSALTVFPNPATNKVQIRFLISQQSNVDITLQTPTGEQLRKIVTHKSYEAGRHEIQEDISSLPPGVYFISIQTNAGTFTQKMIVTK